MIHKFSVSFSTASAWFLLLMLLSLHNRLFSQSVSDVTIRNFRSDLQRWWGNPFRMMYGTDVLGNVETKQRDGSVDAFRVRFFSDSGSNLAIEMIDNADPVDTMYRMQNDCYFHRVFCNKFYTADVARASGRSQFQLSAYGRPNDSVRPLTFEAAIGPWKDFWFSHAQFGDVPISVISDPKHFRFDRIETGEKIEVEGEFLMRYGVFDAGSRLQASIMKDAPNFLTDCQINAGKWQFKYKFSYPRNQPASQARFPMKREVIVYDDDVLDFHQVVEFEQPKAFTNHADEFTLAFYGIQEVPIPTNLNWRLWTVLSLLAICIGFGWYWCRS